MAGGACAASAPGIGGSKRGNLRTHSAPDIFSLRRARREGVRQSASGSVSARAYGGVAVASAVHAQLKKGPPGQ